MDGGGQSRLETHAAAAALMHLVARPAEGVQQNSRRVI